MRRVRDLSWRNAKQSFTEALHLFLIWGGKKRFPANYAFQLQCKIWQICFGWVFVCLCFFSFFCFFHFYFRILLLLLFCFCFCRFFVFAAFLLLLPFLLLLLFVFLLLFCFLCFCFSALCFCCFSALAAVLLSLFVFAFPFVCFLTFGSGVLLGGALRPPPTPPAPRNLHFISDTRACHEINILR